MLQKRCAAFDVNLRPQLKIYLIFLTENPAYMALAFHAIYHDEKGRSSAIGDYGLSEFSFLFPTGFPSQNTLQYAWQHQKVSEKSRGKLSDNRIDDPDCFFAKYDERQWPGNPPELELSRDTSDFLDQFLANALDLIYRS